MPLRIDPSLPEDVRVLIKSAYHMCNKAKAEYSPSGSIIGYYVPKREFDRVRSKVGKLVSFVGEEDGHA